MLKGSEATAKYATTEEILRWIEKDVELAMNLSWSLDDWKEVDIEVICVKMANHIDPGVRKAIAENRSTSKKLLKQLLKDIDPSVTKAAKDTLG